MKMNQNGSSFQNAQTIQQGPGFKLSLTIEFDINGIGGKEYEYIMQCLKNMPSINQ